MKRFSDLGTTEVVTTTFGYDSLARLDDLKHGTVASPASLVDFGWARDVLNRVTQAVSNGGGLRRYAGFVPAGVSPSLTHSVVTASESGPRRLS